LPGEEDDAEEHREERDCQGGGEGPGGESGRGRQG
jgi:hypothetical protein